MRTVSLFVSLALITAPVALCASTFTVTNTNLSGAGSLAQAILDANGNPGADVIAFNIPTGARTITPTNALPIISDSVTIDATVQPGYSNAPIVEIDGVNAGSGGVPGFNIATNTCVIRGLAINRFSGPGISITNGVGSRVQGCYLGVARDGFTRRGNGGAGVYIASPNYLTLTTSSNVVGGIGVTNHNLISANGFGVYIQDAQANTVIGNYIGTDANGASDLGNTNSGVYVWDDLAAFNTIGGTNTGEANLISGNGENPFNYNADGVTFYACWSNNVIGNFIGVDVTGTFAIPNSVHGVNIQYGGAHYVGGSGQGNLISGNNANGVNIGQQGESSVVSLASLPVLAEGNVVEGNLIGTDVTGQSAIPNQNAGVRIINDIGNLIGGSGPGEGNVISGNLAAGIELTCCGGAHSNAVVGNLIGVTRTGALPLGNQYDGVHVGSPFNTIGGTNAADANVIAYNGGNGVFVYEYSYDVPILRNSIYGNGNLGIDLIGFYGVNFNDPGDSDAGGNYGQNYPVLNFPLQLASQTVISGSLNSLASGIYRIELFDNYTNNASGYGEGQTFLAALYVVTDGSGDATFAFTNPAALPLSHFITATATDTNGNTSEFSFARRVVRPDTLDLSVTLADSSEPAAKSLPLIYTVTVTNNGPTNATGVVAVDPLPAGVSFVSAVSSQGTCTQSAGVVTCNIGALPAGSGAVISITVNAIVTGTISNTVSAIAHETDIDLSNNSATEETFVGVAELNIRGTASPNPVVAGQPITYTLFATNAGPDTATGVAVSVYTDYNEYVTGASSSQGSTGVFPQFVSASLGSLAPHATATVTITAIPLITGDVTIYAYVGGLEYDINSGNNNTNLTVTATNGPGVLQFSSAFYTVNEGAGTATIVVNRTGGAIGTVSVDFATSNLTAIAGTDYTATNGTLTFPNGVTERSFQVKILDDGLADCNQSLRLRLFNPTGSAVLIGTTNATLQIFNNHRTPAGVVQCATLANTNLITTGNSTSFNPSVSEDGRYVVFGSYANNLVSSPQSQGNSQIFLADLLAGTRTLVSLDVSNVFAANSYNASPRISSDGKRVAFLSAANNLTTNNTTGPQQLYLRDLAAGTNLLASLNTNGDGGNSSVSIVSISTNGTKVAYTSYSTDLTKNDTNGTLDVFFFDATTGSNVLVSVNSAGTAPGNYYSDDPAISDDGRYVAFASYASNLSPADNNSRNDIFRRDVIAGTTALVSANTIGQSGNSSCGDKVFISGDGRYVAFESYDSDLGPATPYFAQEIFVRDMVAGTTILASLNNSSNAANATCYLRGLSRDARYVLFESYANNLTTNNPSFESCIYLRDTLSNVTTLVNVNLSGTGPANGSSDSPLLSRNGRYVTFSSTATDLVAAGKSSSVSDVFVRDMQTGIITLLSTVYGGSTGGDGSTQEKAISENGVVAFGTGADNLTQVDSNGNEDIYARGPGDPSPKLLSRGTGLTANGTAFDQRITGDGSKVAFASYAANMVSNDTNLLTDVYLRDLNTGVITLLSVNAPGNASGDGQSDQPRPSWDGRFVAYRNDQGGGGGGARPAINFNSQFSQIYLRDAVSNMTTLISINKNGNAPGNGPSQNPEISSNGTFIVFQSHASDLISNDLNGATSDVFIRNRTNSAVELISANSAGTGSANMESYNPVVSADGRYVAFESSASNLGPPHSNTALTDIYVRDRQTGSNILCSPNLAGTDGGNDSSYGPVISASGRYVAFVSSASNFTAGDTNQTSDVFVFDVQARTLRLVSTTPGGIPGDSSSYNPSLSADGRYVAFDSASDNLVANDSNGMIGDVFVRDMVGNTTTLVSVNCAGTGSGSDQSFLPRINANGRYVAFQSYASDLVGGDFSASAGDIFRRDLQAATTVLVSQNRTLLGGGNGYSSDPRISDNGIAISFVSGATDLIFGDANSTEDIFAWSSGAIVGVDLALTKSASVGTVAQGASLAYTLAVTNYGLANATSVVITDALPASLTFVSASTSQGTFTNNSGLFTCNVGNLNVAAGARITINVTPTVAGYVTNTAICSSAQSDLASGNNTSTAIVLVTAPPAPTLSFVVTNTSQLFLNWPVAGTGGYNLETSTNVAPGSIWSGVTNSVNNNGLINYVILNMSPAEKARFYRLHHP